MRAGCLLAILAAAATGCKPDRDDPAERNPAPLVVAELPAELVRWMPPGFATSWEGAWIARGVGITDDDGTVMALEVRGAEATLFDGERERALRLAIVAPCIAEFTETSSRTRSLSGGQPMEITGTVTREVEFVVQRGTVRAGRGWVGYRNGRAAIACRSRIADGGIFTIDAAGACAEWVDPSSGASRWQQRPATCAWSVANGKDVLTIDKSDGKVELVAAGDVLMDEAFSAFVEASPLARAKDFAAAKGHVPLQGLGAAHR